MRILQLSLFLSLLLHCCTAKRDYYTYLDHNYAVDYPITWQITYETDGLKLSPNDNYGDVKIANYPTTDRPVESMKEFILGLSNAKDSSRNVKMTITQDVIEYYYEYTDTGFKRIIKVIRRDNNFHLLRMNCQLNKWDMKKHVFLHIVESFHFR
jgi:hypothetical protein